MYKLSVRNNSVYKCLTMSLCLFSSEDKYLVDQPETKEEVKPPEKTGYLMSQIPRKNKNSLTTVYVSKVEIIYVRKHKHLKQMSYNPIFIIQF